MAMDEYLRLLPTLLYILSVFGLVFAIVAGVAKRVRGPAAVWTVWGVYVLLVTGSCIIALTRFTAANGSIAPRLIYYLAVAFAAVGFPLWCSARALLALAVRSPAIREPWQVMGAWAVSVVTAPLGLLLMFGVDRIAAELQWSPFGS
jgi:hypothetical protein